MTVMTKPIGRRTVLRGAGGAVVALPWLEAMAPRRAKAALAPKRFVVWHAGIGTVPDKWCPTGGETDFQLSPILSPLERHKQDLIVIQGLRLLYGYGHNLGANLTGRDCVNSDSNMDIATGPSIDQYIVQNLGLAQQTRI